MVQDKIETPFHVRLLPGNVADYKVTPNGLTVSKGEWTRVDKFDAHIDYILRSQQVEFRLVEEVDEEVDYDSLTVKELRVLCNERNIDSNGLKKPELISLLKGELFDESKVSDDEDIIVDEPSSNEEVFIE